MNAVEIEEAISTLAEQPFDPARLSVEIKDRFGQAIIPREWFLVLLPVIDETVDRIRDQSITQFQYDPTTARLVKVAA